MGSMILIIMEKQKTETAKVTIEIIADEAGVSPSTVSRVLNKPNLVKAKTRNAVYEALRKHNYVPPAANREQDESGRNYTIGLAIHNPHLSVVADLIREIEDTIDTSGNQYDLLIINMHGEKDLGKFFREHAHYRKKIDALISFSVSLSHEDARAFQDQNIPIALLQARCTGAKSISTNNFQGALDAVEYLFSRGYEQIAFIGWDFEDSRLLDRLAGYKASLNRHSRSADEAFAEYNELSVQGGYQATARLLERVKPDAVFYACDSMAIGGMKYCREQNIAVPDELGIIGFDGLDIAEVMGLTTMKQFINVKADMAIAYLLQRIEGTIPEPQADELCITPRIIVRSTTK